METNKEWKSTNYHQHAREDDYIKLEDGCYYEIGFQNLFSDTFRHQGIKVFNKVFLDEAGYPLRPFPTHARKIELTIPIINYGKD